MGDPDKKENSLQVAAKTPVSLLQELYVRKGITPKYDLVQVKAELFSVYVLQLQTESFAHW